jgi:glycosyltransferase involved in cell wall biosynthesis
MRIVLASPSLPRGDGRTDGRVLACLLRELARRGHDITCVSSHEEPAHALAAAQVLADAAGYELVDARLRLRESYVGRKVASARRPYSEHARSTTLQPAVDATLRRGYDVLHVEDPFLARALARHERRVTYLHYLEYVDLWGHPVSNAHDQIRRWQLRRATNEALRSEPHIIAMSHRLAREAARWHSRRIPIVPAAFDAAEFGPTTCNEPSVGVIGSMHWHPSRSAAERVLDRLWNRIHARVPEARLLVAGWGSEHYLSRYFPRPGAELLGAVPNADDLFSRCSVLLYPPPRGTGMKIKILDALARGLAVVSNEEGLEGLPDDAPVRRGETDDELVAETVALLANPTIRADLASQGPSFVASRVNAGVAADKLLEAYEAFGLMRTSPSARP